MISFTRHRNKSFLLSALLVAVSLLSLALNGFNLGIDFAGGTIFQLNFREQFTLEEVEEVLEKEGLSGAALQLVQGRDPGGEAAGEGVVIKTSYLDEEERRKVIAAFRERFPSLGAGDVRVESVGAVVGREMVQQALLALAVAVVLMVAYIAFRFEFKFSLATILALLHDIIVVAGVFSLLRLEVNSTFVAAILTVFGYSVNNTIVIIDRIRENLRHKRPEEYAGVVDLSISQSLVRCLNTSLTTLLVLVALFVGFYYFIGSFDLIAFVIAIIIGVAVGTYSSIFVASPLWFTFKEWEFRRRGKAA
ncbi:MAG: protein translocase subunit SecF [Dethiobacteria bacterium]